jgi:hypothetical protein
MNLVQINERLKDLPMQVVQQYANGMNPEVPPYLALGELQRREMSQKQMATAQGAMQGAQPSVKEQVEQKAGLMALQQMQQQQMAQQMAQPRGPMPAPEGIAQPEDQPEATMMAGGGLANVPVQFDFAGGGIVAFQSGGSVEEKYRRESEEMGEGKRTKYSPDVQAYALQKRAADNAGQDAYMKREQERQLAGSPMMSPQPQKANQVGTRRYSSTPYGTGYDLPENVLPPTVENVFFDKSGMRQGRPKGMSDEAWNKARLAAAGTEQQPTSQGPGDQFAPRYPQSGLPAAANRVSAAAPARPPRVQAPRPTPQIAPPAAPAAPAQPDPNSMEAMFRAQLAKPSTPRTMAEVLAEQRAAREGAGMGEPAGLAQLDRIRKMQEQYEGGKPSGLDDLIRVFGQAGQYKGLSGMGPAYTANEQQKRAQDLAMAQKINEMMSGVETTQRGEMKDIASGALSGLGTDRATAASREKDVLSALGTGRGQDITASTAEENRKTLERGQDLQFKASMAQVNATLARTNMDLTQNQRVALADKAIDNVNNMIKADMRLSMQISKNPTLRDDLVRKETDRLLAVATGAKIPAAPGAASPGGTSTSGWGKAQVVNP